MKRAHAHELQEDARPALVLDVSEQRFRHLFPIRFSRIEPFTEAEPSTGALVELKTGGYVIVVYGTITHRATISVPISSDIASSIRALLDEAPIRASEVVWTADEAGALDLAPDEPRRAGAR